MEYANPERRKNKRDERAKRRYNKYRRGGRFRTANVSFSGRKLIPGMPGKCNIKELYGVD